MALINWKKNRTVMAFFCLFIHSPHSAFGHLIIVFIFSAGSLLTLFPNGQRCLLIDCQLLKTEARSSFLDASLSLVQLLPLTLFKTCLTFLKLSPESSFIYLFFLPSVLLLSWLRELTIAPFHSFVYCLSVFYFLILLQSYASPL